MTVLQMEDPLTLGNFSEEQITLQPTLSSDVRDLYFLQHPSRVSKQPSSFTDGVCKIKVKENVMEDF